MAQITFQYRSIVGASFPVQPALVPDIEALIDKAPSSRQKFLRYYGLRGSTIFSKGAHDEWNIVLALNAKRAIGEDIAVYFDGKPVEPGDYQDSVDVGYETQLR